jgi:hypothetical protein
MNILSEKDLASTLSAAGFSLTACEQINAADDFEQLLFCFTNQAAPSGL